MSQKIAIDLVLNKADTATSIKETKAAIKDLQNAALNLEQGSAGFNKLISKAGELKDRINDVQDTTKVLAGNTVETLTNSFGRMSASAVGGFQAIIGLQTAFGDESKATIQTLTQLQGLMAFTSGIKDFANLGQSVKDFSTSLSVAISKITAKTTVTEIDTAATEAATVAQEANNVAMAASPIGIFVIALLAVGGAFLYFKNKNDEATKSILDFNIKLGDLNNTYNQLATDVNSKRLDFGVAIGGLSKYDSEIQKIRNNTKKDIADLTTELEKLSLTGAKDADLVKQGEKYAKLSSPADQKKFIEDIDNIKLKSFLYEKKSIEDRIKLKQDEGLYDEMISNTNTFNALRRLDFEKTYQQALKNNIAGYNEFNKIQKEANAQRTKDIDTLNLAYGPNLRNTSEYLRQLEIINLKADTAIAQARKTKDDKAKQDALSTRETNLNILKEGYVKTQSIITDQYQIEKQLLSDKYAEAKRINANGKQGELALTAQYNLQLVQLEKSKNNMLLVLAQENAARQSSIIQNRVQSLLERGQAPVDYIGKLQSSTRTQAQADFAASDSGRKLVEAGKLAGSSPEASKLFQDLQAEEQAFIETRMRAIKGTTDAIKIAGLDITTTNKNLYNTEASFLLNIQNMTFESYKNSQEQINQYKKEQLDKNMEAELIAAGDNEKAKAEIRAKYALQETQLKDDIRRKNIENEISTLNTVKQYAETGLQAIEDVYDLFNAQREAKDVKSKAEEEKRAKDRFYVFKALNLSLAVVQGYINSQAAFKGIALATDPFSKAAAIAQFVATTVQSAVTVAKIAASEYKSSATSGGASGAQNTAASINLYGQGGNQNNLSVTNQNQRDKDIRVYVVENDISQAQTNVGRYKTSVSLG